MSHTFLDITNIVLRDINEVPLTSLQFNSARGIQSFVKESVNRAYMDIVSHSKEWPWLDTSFTDNTETIADISVNVVKGVKWTLMKPGSTGYHGATPDYASIDWDTFFLTDNGEVFKNLQKMDYDQWDDVKREDDAVVDSEGEPIWVIRSTDGRKFALSPRPDKDYTITFNAWEQASIFVNETDLMPFPEQFYNVIVARSRYYVWMFRENVQQANMAKQDYFRHLARMEDFLLGNTNRAFRLV